MHACMHACIHACMHGRARTHTHTHTCIPYMHKLTYRQTDRQCIHADIHKCIHTYIGTHMLVASLVKELLYFFCSQHPPPWYALVCALVHTCGFCLHTPADTIAVTVSRSTDAHSLRLPPGLRTLGSAPPHSLRTFEALAVRAPLSHTFALPYAPLHAHRTLLARSPRASRSHQSLWPM